MRRPPKALAALVLSAACLRLPGIFDDLWLDEIWNWTIARAAASPADILLRIHVDTNHILNTLVLYCLGDRLWWPIYRLHSLAAGTASVALIAVIARRWGRRESLLAAFLAGASYLLTLYSSEARGYSMLVFFSLGSFILMERFLADGRRRTWMFLSLCIALGFLSHLMFLQTYLALSAWSARRIWGESLSWARAGRRWAACHAPALSFMAFLYMVQVRHLIFGGGPQYPPLDMLRGVVAASLGLPEGWFSTAALGAAALAVVVAELAFLRREGSDEWIFHGVAGLLCPGLLVAFHPHGFLYARYFLVPLAFQLALAARFLARVSRRGPTGKALCAAFLLGYAWGNGWKLSLFWKLGRGHYLEAVRYMAARTPGRTVTIGGDHDFAHKMMVSFYARYLPADKRVVYREAERWTSTEPEWAIVHEWRRGVVPPTRLLARNGSRYVLAKAFLSCDLSGWNWFVYRRKPFKDADF